jgi:hypothetical protein
MTRDTTTEPGEAYIYESPDGGQTVYRRRRGNLTGRVNISKPANGSIPDPGLVPHIPKPIPTQPNHNQLPLFHQQWLL